MEKDCIFCKIVSGEIPSETIYDDENFLVFLDINPQSPGHSLVIPKKHYRWVWDYPNAGEYFEVAKKIALAQRKAFDTEFIVGKIIGDEVPHAHIWVLPNKNIPGDKSDLKGNGEKIRKHLVPSS